MSKIKYYIYLFVALIAINKTVNGRISPIIRSIAARNSLHIPKSSHKKNSIKTNCKKAKLKGDEVIFLTLLVTFLFSFFFIIPLLYAN